MRMKTTSSFILAVLVVTLLSQVAVSAQGKKKKEGEVFNVFEYEAERDFGRTSVPTISATRGKT